MLNLKRSLVANRKNDEVIEKLANQPLEVMEKVLANASRELYPIEIDGIVYHIPKPVSDLIDAISIQAGLDDPPKKREKTSN